ncbi:MAG: D-alanyl-D-alanine carboxypeptidase family protein, partial [Candidatus Binataceae bacterium]
MGEGSGHMQVAKLGGGRRAYRLVTAIVILAVLGLVPAGAALASHTRSHHRKIHRRIPRIAAPLYHAELLEDADSGRILYQYNPDLPWPPASMAKMMLLLVTEEQIKAGRLKLTDPVVISARSAHTGGSRLGLREGQVYPLGELIKAALIRSANDAAVAIGQKVGGGSIDTTVRMMNARAKSLGMTGTHYNTVDGLPPTPGHDVDVTDARDLATVARALIQETDLLRWSAMEAALFDGGVAI